MGAVAELEVASVEVPSADKRLFQIAQQAIEETLAARDVLDAKQLALTLIVDRAKGDEEVWAAMDRAGADEYYRRANWHTRKSIINGDETEGQDHPKERRYSRESQEENTRAIRLLYWPMSNGKPLKDANRDLLLKDAAANSATAVGGARNAVFFATLAAGLVGNQSVADVHSASRIQEAFAEAEKAARAVAAIIE